MICYVCIGFITKKKFCMVLQDFDNFYMAPHDLYDCLREFVYSRHPDPRRVWKGGSEQHLLTPLPRAPRAPGANSKKLDLAMFYDDFATFARSF